MTREQHLEKYNSERAAAKEALTRAIESHPFSYDAFQEYKAHDKLANKHWGIAQAMFTRKHNKIMGYKEF